MSHRHKRPPPVRRRMMNEPESASPLEIALNRAALLTERERTEILEPVHKAFEAFRIGLGSLDHWARIVDAMNIATVLAHRQIASDHKGTFDAAHQALAAVFGRHEEKACWTLRGAEIAALDLAVFVHKVQLDHCSPGELANAVSTVINRVRAALAGNASPSAHVCIPGQLGAKPAMPAHP